MNGNGFIWHMDKAGNGVIDGFSGRASYIEIPESFDGYCPVTAIGGYAFECCEYLEHVMLPHTIKRIETCAFWGCSHLSKVKFPDSLEYMGAGSFYACPLQEIYLPSQLKNSFRELFIGDKHVPLMYQDDGDCFEVFTRQGLKKISVSDGDLRFTSENGVLFDKNMKTLLCYPPLRDEAYYTIPPGTAVIGEDSFYLCKKLEKVILPDSLRCIENFAFSESGLKKLWVPDNVEKIGRNAFLGCENLEEIYLSENLRNMGEDTFNGCCGLNIYREECN
ncbi:leucine-rich repeat domain-containing protein [Blautia schinkii]|nr:leucine-rich repeat domain-containing protein [Blautia schinkii]